MGTVVDALAQSFAGRFFVLWKVKNESSRRGRGGPALMNTMPDIQTYLSDRSKKKIDQLEGGLRID